MYTLGQLATRLEEAIAGLRRGLFLGCETLGDETVKEARSYIGYEIEEWPPLADSTVAEKERLGYVDQRSGTDPLLRTWNLFDSVGRQVAYDGDGVELAVGSYLEKALYLEMGTSKMPPRPLYSLAMSRTQKRADEIFGLFGMALVHPEKKL